ncbi:hypothetical protein FGF1_34940 [Flavobacteriaceae bacterium GF1]
MIEYKPKTVNIALNVILTVLFVIIVIFFLEKGQYLLTMICVIVVYYVFSLLFKKRVIGIKIDSDLRSIKVTYTRYGVLRHTEQYRFDNVSITYNTETGPRGIKRKELRLYDSLQNMIFKIIPNYEGWSRHDLEAIYKLLSVSL